MERRNEGEGNTTTKEVVGKLKTEARMAATLEPIACTVQFAQYDHITSCEVQ